MIFGTNERIRQLVQEINVGGQEVDTSPDEEEGDQNFMDDDSSSDTNDAPASDDTADTSDDGEEGDQNFMDDGDAGGDEPSGDDTANTSDDEEEGDQNFMDDDSSGDSGDDTSGEGSDDQAADDGEEGDQDFMDDGDGGDESSGDDSEDSGEEDGSSDEENNEEGEEDSYDLNKIENELFSDLTPEQIAIKNHELKEQFIELYSIIGSTLVRINDISKSNNNINVLKFVTEKLLELREMIDFNITTAYQTRTYIENNIIYQQCVATLNSIADIIDNIPKLGDVPSSEDNNEEDDDKGVPVEDDTESSDVLNVSDTSTITTQESSDYSSDFNILF